MSDIRKNFTEWSLPLDIDTYIEG